MVKDHIVTGINNIVVFHMYHPIDMIIHTTAFDLPVEKSSMLGPPRRFDPATKTRQPNIPLAEINPIFIRMVGEAFIFAMFCFVSF